MVEIFASASDLIQSEKDVDYDPREWLSLSIALSRLAKVMRSIPAAKDLLQRSLETGNLTACASLMREEWDIGSLRREGSRSGRYIISPPASSPLGMISINKRYFTRKPRGAKRQINWSKSSLAWIAPPGRLFINKRTGERGRVVSKRIAMFEVVVLLRQYKIIIDGQRTTINRSRSARTAGLANSHFTQKQWETVRLKSFYDQAYAGTLESDSFNLDIHRAKKEFAEKLMVYCEKKYDKSRLRAYLRQVDRLRTLNRRNRKNSETDEWQTDKTIVSP